MKTEQRKLSTLTEYEANARINGETVIALQGLMDKFGYLVPMVVTEEGVIVAGHARFKALKKEGVDVATCVIIEGNEKADEFRLLDNKIHELSGWDDEKLSVELRGLESVREMFPSLETEKVELTGPTTVTAQSVDETKEQLNTQYGKLAEGQKDQRVRVRCDCGKEFQVKRWELER